MYNKVLIIDDEEEIREEYNEYFSDADYECFEARNAEQALEVLRNNEQVGIVIVDINMPGRSGLEFIASAQNELPEDRLIQFIVVTGHGGAVEAIDAVRLNVLDFVNKPADPSHLLLLIKKAEEINLLKYSKICYDKSLEAEILHKTHEIQKLLKNLEEAYAESLECLATAAELKDPETGNHIRRIGSYAQCLAAELGLSKERQQLIGMAAPLHDVGKIGTPDDVLLKPGKLTPEEVVIMKQHSEIGYQILRISKHPVMVCAANIARYHHERWDGKGYPRGLAGEEIPIEARITTLVDVYDALRSKRPYKPEFSHEKSVAIITEGDGRTEPHHFDPAVLAAFKRKTEEFNAIYLELAD